MSAVARSARVKICGITNQQDALDAIDAGADAIGFNFFRGSRRFIDLEREAGWIAALPPFVTKVAVLVNAPFDEARQIAEHPAIDLLQLHGDEDEHYCAEFAKLGRPFIKALRLMDAASLENIPRFSTQHILIDAHVASEFGGTGRRIDLELAAECVRRFPDMCIVLAGGLKPESVAGAVRRVRPYAVDVATGVESEPRRKSRDLMAAFVREACGAAPL